MHACPSCGREITGEFAFCPHCGAPLAAPAPAREQRKTVTVLFCDVTGSTALGESVDPEALRALLARYFERMKGIVGRLTATSARRTSPWSRKCARDWKLFKQSARTAFRGATENQPRGRPTAQGSLNCDGE